MKRFRNVILGILVLTYLAIAIGFVSGRRGDVLCNKLDIIIIDSASNNLVSKSEIRAFIMEKYKNLFQTRIDSIQIHKIEEKVNSYPAIKSSEIYKTIQGSIVIKIKQRSPIARVYSNSKNSYYIDNEGVVIPYKSGLKRLLVVNGNIGTDFKGMKNINYDSLVVGVKADSSEIMHKIYEMAKHIKADPFLDAQIEQMYVNEQHEFELIPKVGNFVIVFGDTIDAKEKFAKLKAMYFDGIGQSGWNKYKILNLKYTDQVVCTRRD